MWQLLQNHVLAEVSADSFPPPSRLLPPLLP